jgi:hypothetical protein
MKPRVLIPGRSRRLRLFFAALRRLTAQMGRIQMTDPRGSDMQAAAVFYFALVDLVRALDAFDAYRAACVPVDVRLVGRAVEVTVRRYDDAPVNDGADERTIH